MVANSNQDRTKATLNQAARNSADHSNHNSNLVVEDRCPGMDTCNSTHRSLSAHKGRTTARVLASLDLTPKGARAATNRRLPSKVVVDPHQCNLMDTLDRCPTHPMVMGTPDQLQVVRMVATPIPLVDNLATAMVTLR